jgi:hypothetical protein
MSTSPLTAAIADYRAQEKAAKAAGNQSLAFELGNILVGLQSLEQAHEARVAPLTRSTRTFFVEEDLGDGFAQVQREDYANDFASADDAIAAAAELWAENDNGLLGLPAYRVASVTVQGHRDYGVSADPIDCRP